MQTHIKSLNTKLPFTQAVRCGDFVYVSGQASVDPMTGEIRSGTLSQEMTLSFQNLREVLDSADARWSQIVKLNCFLRKDTDLAEYNQLYRQFFQEPFPARTTVTNCLPLVILFEVDCIAYAPPGNKSD